MSDALLKRGPSDLNAGAKKPAVCRSVWAMILSAAPPISLFTVKAK
ncbi:hypothetical protein KCP77_07495 [Salmonella enterica subsp. enterica]|nr:hypothetical protein KCP77_07495 [Salmonella enterica subsp. enterica]